jgi:transcriptional/translational regulatory protein YebC/TACO1
MFERLGRIVYPTSAGSEDAMMDAAIEAGAQDAESDSEEGHVILTTFEDLGAVAEALEASLGPAKSTSIIWKAKTDTPVAGDDVPTLIKLIEALEDDDDVQNVWTNADIDEEALSKISA